jgi:HAD superfamily hydrolase (TIGR01509 family)
LPDVLRAVLFDLDGTLVDTERESAEALRRVMTRLGLTMTAAELDFVIGHSWLQIHEVLRRGHGPALPLLPDLIAASAAEREIVMAERGVTVLPGARAVAQRLAAHYALAIVTGSSRREARAALAAAGLADLFPLILAAEDYSPGKPDPRGLLLAAERLGAQPAECLVIEDSAPGVAAGRAAGMTVVAVRIGNFAAQDQSAAHAVVETLEAIDEALLGRLFAPGCQTAPVR